MCVCVCVYTYIYTKTGFYSHVARFVNTLPSSVYVGISYTGFKPAEYVIRILVAAPQEYVSTYPTRRVLTQASRCGTDIYT